jgi:acetyltransferase-like isoleucine patch superfamily enzyme
MIVVAIVAHECVIGNSVFIAGGCHFAGKITIESGAYIGTGATILPRLTIGECSIIGAGAVVTKDVPLRCRCCQPRQNHKIRRA